MPPFESLVARIRGEYREMPGLRLTFSQACRLWQMDGLTCESVLEQLVGEAFLYEAANGTYIALPTTTKRDVTAQLRSAQFSLRRSA